MNDLNGCTSFLLYQQVNVLPSHAEAVVNLRIHSAQTLQEVRDHTVAVEMLPLCSLA